MWSGIQNLQEKFINALRKFNDKNIDFFALPDMKRQEEN